MDCDRPLGLELVNRPASAWLQPIQMPRLVTTILSLARPIHGAESWIGANHGSLAPSNYKRRSFLCGQPKVEGSLEREGESLIGDERQKVGTRVDIENSKEQYGRSAQAIITTNPAAAAANQLREFTSGPVWLWNYHW